MKSYSELILLPTFEERLHYLRTGNIVAEETFGSKRYLNQMLYNDDSWKSVRRRAILRDSDGDYILDLAHKDFPFKEGVYVHHINPISIEDILERRSCVFDLNNLVCCSFVTHQDIHYGSSNSISRLPANRTKNDTCPWR